MKVAEVATETLDENLFHLASDSLNLNHDCYYIHILLFVFLFLII